MNSLKREPYREQGQHSETRNKHKNENYPVGNVVKPLPPPRLKKSHHHKKKV